MLYNANVIKWSNWKKQYIHKNYNSQEICFSYVNINSKYLLTFKIFILNAWDMFFKFIWSFVDGLNCRDEALFFKSGNCFYSNISSMLGIKIYAVFPYLKTMQCTNVKWINFYYKANMFCDCFIIQSNTQIISIYAGDIYSEKKTFMYISFVWLWCIESHYLLLIQDIF